MIDMHPDHRITVTPGPFGRAWFDCTCRPLVNSIWPSKRAANRAALRHHHDVMGCNCPAWLVAHEIHPDPGTGSPAPVAAPAIPADAAHMK